MQGADISIQIRQIVTPKLRNQCPVENVHPVILYT